jgi:hypothetical protein
MQNLIRKKIGFILLKFLIRISKEFSDRPNSADNGLSTMLMKIMANLLLNNGTMKA